MSMRKSGASKMSGAAAMMERYKKGERGVFGDINPKLLEKVKSRMNNTDKAVIFASSSVKKTPRTRSVTQSVQNAMSPGYTKRYSDLKTGELKNPSRWMVK